MRKHNYFAHPLMQLCYDFSLLAEKIIPEHALPNTICHALTGRSVSEYLRKMGDNLHDHVIPPR